VGFAVQENQGHVIEAKQDEILDVFAKFRRDIATYMSPKDVMKAEKKRQRPSKLGSQRQQYTEDPCS
jgi:hypothetical protein